MAADFIVRSDTVPAGTVGSTASARLNKRQELVVMPWEMSLAVEGRLFIANRSTLSAPTAATSAVITDLRPDIVVRVPSGTTIFPLRIETYVEAMTGGGTLLETMARGCANDVGAGTSTAVTPVNMSPNNGRGTNCIVARDYTADCTAPTSPFEFYRDGYPTEVDVTLAPFPTFVWSFQKDGAAPALRGPASLMYHFGGATAATTTYYAIIVWAEFLTSELV